MPATESKNSMLDQVFHNIRQAAEANLKLQQEAVRQWSSLWPVAAPQNSWTDSVRNFQKKWTSAISELAHKHREVMDQQYQAAVDSLDAALHVSESTTPEECRKRSEQLCRKTLDCVRDVSEAQIQEFQNVVS